jgi:hypothetical protein
MAGTNLPVWFHGIENRSADRESPRRTTHGIPTEWLRLAQV